MLRTPVVTGKTLVIPLVGHPVEQVKTPGPMNLWFAEHGVDAVVVPIDIRPERAASFFEVLKATENCAGCTVTMPHKQAAFAACDEVSARARRAKAVNIMRRTPTGKLIGDMTDGVAMVMALRQHGVQVAGSNVMVIGAGGAGTAIAHAVAEEGAASLTVIEPDQMRQRALLVDIERFHPQIAVSEQPVPTRPIDIAINASPAGMHHHDPYPYPPELLPAGSVLADAITHPVVTRWLTEAARRGARIQTGEEMALAQVPILLRYLRFMPAKAAAASAAPVLRRRAAR